MAHVHTVFDDDLLFIIDPVSRVIEYQGDDYPIISQKDHNSEKFTFEMPRYVDGHDMMLCDTVRVHYVNVDSASNNRRSTGLYRVKDLQISPDNDNLVRCTWLVSQNATLFAGSLSFVLQFACTSGAKIEYSWNTTVYSSVSVVTSIDNAESVVEQHADVLNEWYYELLLSGVTSLNSIEDAKNGVIEEIARAEATRINETRDEAVAAAKTAMEANANTIKNAAVAKVKSAETQALRNITEAEEEAFGPRTPLKPGSGVNSLELSTTEDSGSNAAYGENAAAFGIGTTAISQAQTSLGKYNKPSEDAVLSIGNGSSKTDRSNALEVISRELIDGSIEVAFRFGDTIITEDKFVEILDFIRSLSVETWSFTLDEEGDPVVNKKVAIIGDAKHSTFVFDGKTYAFDDNTNTWDTWMSSSHNTDLNLEVISGYMSVTLSDSKKYYIIDSYGERVRSTDTIGLYDSYSYEVFVTFTIDGDIVTVKLGTTWKQWIDLGTTVAARYDVHDGYIYRKDNGLYLLDSEDRKLSVSRPISACVHTSTGEPIETVTFRIYEYIGNSGYYDQLFTVPAGTTWAEWCESTYTPDYPYNGGYPWYVDTKGNVKNAVDSFTVEDSSGNPVKGTDVIVSGVYGNASTPTPGEPEIPDDPTGPVTFTIGSNTYTVDPGTTWGQWYEEQGETFVTNKNGYVYASVPSLYLVDSNGYGVRWDAAIVAGAYSYSETMIEPESISFRIYAKTDDATLYYDRTYEVPAGTTWAEFCADSYADGLMDYEWKINANGNVDHKVYSIVIKNSSGNYVKGTDAIVSGVYGDGSIPPSDEPEIPDEPDEPDEPDIPDAPTGYITVTINDQSYTIPNGTTWGVLNQALETPYREFEHTNGTILFGADHPVTNNSDNTYLYIDDPLVDGMHYQLDVEFIPVKEIVPPSDEPDDPTGPVTFTIGSNTYTVDPGTTWSQWYATHDATTITNKDGYVYASVPSLYLVDSNGYGVRWDAAIVAGAYSYSETLVTNPNVVTFTIDGSDPITVLSGSTWAEWCDTTYDEQFGECNYKIYNDHVYCNRNMCYVVDSDGYGIRGETAIVAGAYSYRDTLVTR